MKTIIRSLGTNHVTYTTADPFFMGNGIKSINYEFYAPINGGYVVYGKDNRQICERLATTGPTLFWSGETEPLVDLIRRQHKLWHYDNLSRHY